MLTPMKKLFIIFCFFAIKNIYGLHNSQPIPQDIGTTLNQYSFSINEYGNLLIDFEKVDDRTIEDLKSIKDSIEKNWDKRGIIISIPVMIGQSVQALEDIGFELYLLDTGTKRISYIFRNKRAIPDIHIGFTAANIFIYRNNPVTRQKEILIVSEYDKTALTVPAGCSNKGELTIETVLREALEEVGLHLNPANISLAFVSNKIGADGSVQVNMGFEIMLSNDVEISIDNKEIINYAWVELSKLQDKNFMMFGKKLWPSYYKMLFNKPTPGQIVEVGDKSIVIAVK